jgi:hypothetical protein
MATCFSSSKSSSAKLWIIDYIGMLCSNKSLCEYCTTQEDCSYQNFSIISIYTVRFQIFYSTWWRQNIWLVLDLLCQSQHWWSPIINNGWNSLNSRYKHGTCCINSQTICFDGESNEQKGSPWYGEINLVQRLLNCNTNCHCFKW